MGNGSGADASDVGHRAAGAEQGGGERDAGGRSGMDQDDTLGTDEESELDFQFFDVDEDEDVSEGTLTS